MIHLVGPGGPEDAGGKVSGAEDAWDAAEPGAPARIEHVHEVHGGDDEIDDYLVYEWDAASGPIVARAHTDEMHTVSIMTEGPGGLQVELPAEVEAWLRARFGAVRALDGAVYAPLRRSA